MLLSIGVALIVLWVVALAIKVAVGLADVALLLGLAFVVAAFFRWRAGPLRRTPA